MTGGAKGQWDCISTFIQENYTEDLKKVSVPVLVMNGEADQIVPCAPPRARAR
jgi:non-heme chloroperoxidase